MLQAIETIGKTFLNLLYPLRCASCGKDLEATDKLHVCGSCLNSIRPNPAPHCAICGRSLHNAKDICADCRKDRPCFERAYSACVYEGALKDMIHAFKFKRRIALSGTLSKIMVDFARDNYEVYEGIGAITFVPLHAGRLREREFNQSEALARGLGLAFGISCADVLSKARKTAPQNELSKDERALNLAGVFKVKDATAIIGKKVLLIDDVMTTGSTLNECAKALAGAGAKAVRCCTLARGT
ncbi:MAG: ComF family protein [Candidatus Omnitrophica bacterium]|nr:ComF family protein [Candidatus Omnitrophota bacterium]